MNRRLVSTVSVGSAVLALLAAVPLARAGTNSDTISIHFAANEPTGRGGSMLAPTDVAGVVPSANWNNTTTRAGYVPGVVRDTNGVATTTSATVLFEASTTFASTGKGEENNNFDPTTGDYALMSGYFDEPDAPSPSIVVVTNLPADIASGTYDVYLYALGGRSDRGGQYTVNGVGPLFLLVGGDTDNGPQTGPNYVQAVGDDPNYGSNDFGNYLLVPGQTGSTVTVTVTNLFSGFDTHPRAPLNGIQIVVH
jgi:hypothetical protein